MYFVLAFSEEKLLYFFSFKSLIFFAEKWNSIHFREWFPPKIAKYLAEWKKIRNQFHNTSKH